MQQLLRDYAKKQGLTIDYNPTAKKVKLGSLEFDEGQGEMMGIGYNPDTSQHFVMSEAAINKALKPAQPTNQPFTQASPPPAFDAREQLQNLYEQQRNAQMQALQSRIGSQVADTERQKIGLAPQFQQERSSADAQSMVAAKRLGELMAARGLASGGENITANVGLQSARQNAFANIGQRETTANASLDQRIADLKRAGAGDIEAMEAALAANRTQGMIGELQRQDGRNLDIYKYLSNMGYQRERDQVGDADKQYDRQYREKMDALNVKMKQDEIAWSQSANNPQVKAQILSNQINELKLLNLPQQMQLELRQAEQALTTGSLNQEQIKANIMRIYQEAAQSNTADPRKEAADYVKQINSQFAPNNFADKTEEVTPESGWGPFKKDAVTKKSTAQEQRDAAVKSYLANLLNSGVSEDVLTEIARQVGIQLVYE